MPTVTTISGCPCCASCDCDCSSPGIWSQYTFTVSGITGPGGATTCRDGEGTDGCDLLNGSWTLTKRTGCSWDSGDESPCDPIEPTWTLGCNGTSWVLTTPCVAGSTANSWTLAVASWDGNSAGTFSLSGSAQCCDPLPATIVLSPGGSFTDCPTCCGLTDECLSLSFSTPFGGTYACLNGTSVLLTWNGSAWAFSDTTCAGPTTVALTCSESVWSIDLEFTDDGCGGGAFVSALCDPFQVNFTFTNTCFFGRIDMSVGFGEGCIPTCSSYPDTLTLTLTPEGCSAIPLVMTRSATNEWFVSAPMPCTCPGMPLEEWGAVLTCVGDAWTFSFAAPTGDSTLDPITVVSALPLHLSTSGTMECMGLDMVFHTLNVTVDITE